MVEPAETEATDNGAGSVAVESFTVPTTDGTAANNNNTQEGNPEPTEGDPSAVEGSETLSPSGPKRPGFPEDSEQSQKKAKVETPDEKSATEDGKKAEGGLPPTLTSPLPAQGQQNSETGQDGAENSNTDDPSQQTKEAEAPSTPNNHPGGPQPPQQQQQSAAQAAGMMHQQAQMGYPHQMMGGMMHGQYPPGMMQAYAPYPHGYSGQPPQSMMMGHQQHMPGQAPPGSTTPTSQGGPPNQQGQPPPPGYYGQPQPASADGSQQQQSSMGTPPGAQGSAANRPPHPQGAFPQMAGMMPMQMPMHMMHYGPPGMFFSQYHMPGAMMNPMMAQAAAFGQSPNNPAAGRGGPAPQQQPWAPAPPPRSQGISLSLSCDDEQLSEYQMLVRKQLEIFEAQPEDVESNTQGRKKQVVLGQVGIRCRHCAGFPLRQRGRGAVYYPAKLQGVYQAAQNMASSHLCESCQCIPPQLKAELRTLRDRRDTASGGKQYWADGARAMGLYETEEGLRLRRPEGANSQSPPS